VTDWWTYNQRHLTEALGAVRAALEEHTARDQTEGHEPPVHPAAPDPPAAPPDPSHPAGPPALTTLCALFGLSRFERAVLLMCAGMELDSAFAELCERAQGAVRGGPPTFGLALAAFVEDAHWSALSPTGPLRHWRLIELAPDDSLTRGRLRIDERVLHFLTGTSHMDERISCVVTPVAATAELVPSHSAVAAQVVAIWRANIDRSARCSPATAAPARRWPPRCWRGSWRSTSTAST
jgi:hypothetical protein